jgi:hypothetical protein
MMTNAAPEEMSRRRTGWLLAPLVILVLPLCVLAMAAWFTLIVSVEVLVWLLWLPRGRDVLLVYSNSPHWQTFFETQVLPRVSNRAVVLNWSERKSWRMGLATLVFRCFAGGKDFNPIAFHFRAFRRHTTYRFFQPIRTARKADDCTELNQLMARFTADVGC